MIKNSTLYPLFPTIVYKSSLDRELTPTEITEIYSTEVFEQGLGNEISSSSWILDNPIFSNLKNELMLHVHSYMKELMKIEIDLYMTNSWINVTGFQKQHSAHNHTNSILSGVYYFKTSDSQPNISFNRLTPPFFLNMKATEYTPANSIEWTVPVEDGEIIIFPSTCFHYVKPNLTQNERISIAFNTFARGTIGAEFQGADLELK